MSEYRIAFVYSVCAHVLLALSFLWLNSLSKGFETPVIYSVTLEGGKSLGGHSQVPDKEEKKEPPAPLKKVAQPEEIKQTKPEEKPDVVIPTKKEKEVKKKEEKKPEKKPTPKPTPIDVNKQYQQAMQRYLGESANAGGKGFGAAALGGTGMGGGKVVPLEVLSYQRTISNLIKGAWRWHDTSTSLVAKVYFELSPTGAVSKIEVLEGSGNGLFDESVLRAVSKVSPLPPPPAQYYKDYFRFVKLRFDPRE